jgi:hypothetical protein
MKDEILLKKNTLTYNNILSESNNISILVLENIFKKKSIEAEVSNIYYKYIKILEKGYIYVYTYPESDTFDFNINNHTLLITRTDKKEGWGLFLKIKVILNNIEKIFEIGSSSEQIKIIKDDFFQKKNIVIL